MHVCCRNTYTKHAHNKCTLDVSSIKKAIIVRQIKPKWSLCSQMHYSLGDGVWCSLKALCLGRGGVFKCITDKRDGGPVAKSITATVKLSECNISKLIMLKRQWHA